MRQEAAGVGVGLCVVGVRDVVCDSPWRGFGAAAQGINRSAATKVRSTVCPAVAIARGVLVSRGPGLAR